MDNEIFFEIPDDQEVMVRLVKAIPSNWLWVDGRLYAPEALIGSGKAERNTGFSLSRFGSIRPTIVGAPDRKKGVVHKPNMVAIMVEQKRPGFIHFDEAGYDTHDIKLETAKEIAAGFVSNGYRGSLQFFRGCYGNKFDNPAYCSLILEPWQGPPALRREAGPQPARVRLTWNSRFLGKEEDIRPVVGVCRLFNLREYVPKGLTEVAS